MQISIGQLPIDIVRKPIKNVHLAVHPPTGRLRISAPESMSLEAVRAFAATKIGWIRRHQDKLLSQERETPRTYVNRESHYVWGRRCLLQVIEQDAHPTVECTANRLVLRVRPGLQITQRAETLEAWYRQVLRLAAWSMIKKYEHIMDVRVDKLYIQAMRTQWGGYNKAHSSIRLNTDLAKKPRVCLEYVVVHEMAHFKERNHTARFREILDQYLPTWRSVQQTLNQLPLRYEEWSC